MNKINSLPPAGLIRRLGALLYDSLIILAIEIIAAGIVIAIIFALHSLEIVHYGEYGDPAGLLDKHPILSQLFAIYLSIIWICFFHFFWVKTGQTLGMKTWRIQLRNQDGRSVITISQAFIRLATSVFGIANFSMLFNMQQQSFHDVLSKTQIVVLKD
ncbi:RDD family protein [Candidatus Photodesmus anomalopis]|uniref:RDD domain-containing protein n=1 Tax=Candidatus Photodesmus katoptron Akat1 TaxID=1236703 RepID=S3EGK5_9GAMM|nr:RDD family protein [Candidatus Photodesmus katoptron]EPE37278.1 hypothetical protein O1U_0578 [Candidatus Photodesmus katoptron Akat1]